MKKLALIFVILSSGLNFAWAGNIGVDGGVGWASDYGIFGAGARYFMSETWDVHANLGVDLGGGLIGLGTAKYFDSGIDKCFFFFSCHSDYLVGTTLIHLGGGKVTVKDNGVEADYKYSPSDAANFYVGSYDVFPSGFAMGIQIGYRVRLKVPEVTFESGTDTQKFRDDLDPGPGSLSLSAAFGYRF